MAATVVTQPFAIEHLLEEVGKSEGCLIAAKFAHVGDNVSKNIQSDQINRAKRCGFGPPYGLSGQRVYLFDREIHLLHQAHYVQHRKCTDAVGNKVRSVLGKNNAFAELLIFFSGF